MSLVEFALILPIMILLTFGVLELLHATNVAKIAAQLSREAANTTFRECSIITDVNIAQGCVTDRRNEFQQWAINHIDPNTRIIISIYATSPVVPPAVPVLTKLNGTTDATYTSRFTAAPAGFTPAVLALSGQPIYVAEVFIPYTPVVGNIPKIFPFNFPLIYDATVL